MIEDVSERVSLLLSNFLCSLQADKTTPRLEEGDIVEEVNATSVAGLTHGGVRDFAFVILCCVK